MSEEKNTNIKENYRPKEAAEYIGCGLSTVWYYARNGLLNPIKLSPSVTIFKKADIDNFIATSSKEVAK